MVECLPSSEHCSKVQSCLASTPKIVLLTLPQVYCLRHISADTFSGLTSLEELSLDAGGQVVPRLSLKVHLAALSRLENYRV